MATIPVKFTYLTGLKREIFRNARLTGSWDENGRIVSELSIRNGKRSGIILDWYDDGAKKSELVYKDDQLVKKTFWDTDGYVLE